jgi:hypothetical protein
MDVCSLRKNNVKSSEDSAFHFFSIFFLPKERRDEVNDGACPGTWPGTKPGENVGAGSSQPENHSLAHRYRQGFAWGYGAGLRVPTSSPAPFPKACSECGYARLWERTSHRRSAQRRSHPLAKRLATPCPRGGSKSSTRGCTLPSRGLI